MKDDEERDDPPRRSQRPRRERDDGDDLDAADDDRPSRRRRERDDDFDDEDDDRPRRRRRERDDEDEDEDRPRRRRRHHSSDLNDPAMELIVPLNTSGLAIVAGYVGLISVLCFPAPFALILGILALRQLNRNPKLHGRYRAVFGIVMGAMFTLIPLGFILISLLAKK